VRSLTLIEPGAFRLLANGDPTDRLLADEIGSVAADIRDAQLGSRYDDAAERFIDYWNGKGAWQRCSPRLKGMILPAMNRVVENFAALDAPGLTARAVAGIAVPTLVVAGLDTPLPALRTAELVTTAMPAARLALIKGVGHMAPLTDPHIVDPMIGHHLDSVAAATVPVAMKLAA